MESPKGSGTEAMKRDIALTVNGELYRFTVRTGSFLLDVLRDELDLTGAKRGCNRGECGTCTFPW